MKEQRAQGLAAPQQGPGGARRRCLSNKSCNGSTAATALVYSSAVEE